MSIEGVRQDFARLLCVDADTGEHWSDRFTNDPPGPLLRAINVAQCWLAALDAAIEMRGGRCRVAEWINRALCRVARWIVRRRRRRFEQSEPG